MIEEMREEIQTSQAEIESQRESIRSLEQAHEALTNSVTLVANNVQQLVGGHQALGAQLTTLAGQLGVGGKPVDRLAFCSNCREVARTTPTKKKALSPR